MYKSFRRNMGGTMRKKEIARAFGEVFVAQTLMNLGYEVDFLDAEGIDLAAYMDDGNRYGIIVKSISTQEKDHESIALTYHDLAYTYGQSVKRGLVPAYAFIVHKNERIDLLIATQGFILIQFLGVTDIHEYMEIYDSHNASGSTKYLDTSLKSRECWGTLDEDGIIYAATLCLK